MLEGGGDTFYELRQLISSLKLELNKDEVDIYYKTYVNNFKRELRTREESIEQAVNDRLTPGRPPTLGIKTVLEILHMYSREY